MAKQKNVFLKLHPLQRILISGVVAAVVFFLLPKQISGIQNSVILWVAFSFSYLLMSWIVLFTRPIEQIKQTAAKDDGSIPIVFLMILVSSAASLFAVLLLFLSKEPHDGSNTLLIATTIICMFLSWGMVHTLFTFHYAHKYYDAHKHEKKQGYGGLNFPDESTEPDYIDFAYFAFVIGCTFQVSDVEISSRTIRRLAFVHQLISFALNTFVVALTINLVASLSK